MPARPEEAQHESVGREHGPVEATRPLRAEGRVGSPQPKQVAMQRVDRRMALALGEVETASGEGLERAGIGELTLHRRAGKRGELLQEPGPARPNRAAQRVVVVGKEDERAGGTELLALEEHRGARPEQREGGHGAVPPRARELSHAAPATRVGHLIVVLDEGDERGGPNAPRGGTAILSLPGVSLALVEIAVLRCRDELLGYAEVVGVVRLVSARQRDERAVVIVVVPHRVQAVSPFGNGPHHPRVLRLVLRHEQDGAAAGRRARRGRELREDVTRRGVVNGLRCVEAQAVEMELPYPVTGVGRVELAHGRRVGPIEVDGLAPLVRIAAGEVVGGQGLVARAGRTHVVVDNVEDDGKAGSVRAVHEPPQVVGPSVEPGGREQVHPVVAPTEAPGKVGHRHHLDDRDASRAQLVELL